MALSDEVDFMAIKAQKFQAYYGNWIRNYSCRHDYILDPNNRFWFGT